MLLKPEIGSYVDYRQYLSDYFKYRQKMYEGSRSPYTYATFSAACGLKAPQYLKMIIERERNLSEKTLPQISRALGLKKEESLEFRLLVLSNQESDPGKRALLFKELMDYRVAIKLKSGQISKKHFEQIPNWAAWVLFEAADTHLKSNQPKELQTFLRNKISITQIQESLNQLTQSGLLGFDQDQGFTKKRNLIENAEEVPAELVRSLQSQFMYLAFESLYQDPPTDREFGAATLALTKKEFEDIRFKLRQLRKAIQKDNQVARSQAKGERIYQLNIQLYPVTEKTLKID